MLFVSCDGDEGACYEIAGRTCPAGYALYPTMSQSKDHVLLRCRAPRGYPSESHWAASPAPVYPWKPPTAASSPEAPWPNASAPTAPENPWPDGPAPKGSASPQPDLGY